MNYETKGLLFIIFLLIFLCFVCLFEARGQVLNVSGTVHILNDVEYESVVMTNSSSQLIIDEDATLTLTGDVSFTKGDIINYGNIYSEKNINVTISVDYNANQKINTFKNYGNIHVNNFYASIMYNVQGTPLYFDCASGMNAKHIVFDIKPYLQISVNGTFVGECMEIRYENSSPITFGGSCSELEKNLELDTLIFATGLTSVTVAKNSIMNINSLINNAYNGGFKVNVEGFLTVGDISGNDLNIEGTTGSKISLCYNKIKGGKDYNTPKVTAKDTVFYIYDMLDDHSWGDKTPASEGDINCQGCKMLGNVLTRDECMEGGKHFLGYDDDPFLPKGKEIKSHYDCNVCGPDFDEFKIRLEGQTYRLINQGLIYCEGDNFSH